MRRFALGLVALLACGQGTAPLPPPPDPLAVTVQTTGSEPRQLARYTLAKGTTTRLELAIDTELAAGDMGGPSPTFAITLELHVDDVLPDGRMKLATKIVDAAAREREGSTVPLPAASQAADELRAVTLTGTLSPGGKLEDARYDTGGTKLPDSASALVSQVAQSFEQLAMPLPAVPVGPGASWTSTRQLDVGGMQMTSTSTIVLVGIAGTELAYTMTTTLHGDDQQVKRGSLAIDVTNLHGEGDAAGVVDLARLAMTTEFEARFHADMAAAGEKTPIDIATKVEAR
ncbi:MAG TPA: hypothetical protein VGF94_12785 [Kofleriaceae bacterium]|jgi:hypothetical protein